MVQNKSFPVRQNQYKKQTKQKKNQPFSHNFIIIWWIPIFLTPVVSIQIEGFIWNEKQLHFTSTSFTEAQKLCYLTSCPTIGPIHYTFELLG